MVSALAEDFLQVLNLEVVVMRDRRQDNGYPPGCQVLDVRNDEEESRFLSQCAAECDWTVLVAPEFDHLLWDRCRMVAAAGGRLLSPPAEFVRVASDKQRTSELLAAAGVPIPPSTIWPDPQNQVPGIPFPAVLKPNDGAGSMDVQLVPDAERLPVVTSGRSWRLETWCPGMPASASWLAGPGSCLPLPPCAQCLSDDGKFSYLGGWTPLPTPLSERASELAERVAHSLPQATGYVSLDLILGDEGPCSDVVVEVNPRLTTSYLGLRRAARQNLAEAMLAVAQGQDVELRFSRERVEFGAG
jgi:predicted ATP-grasp superfamily ATP-dependent carboligase